MFLTVYFHEWKEFMEALNDGFGLPVSLLTTPIFYRTSRLPHRERFTFVVAVCTVDKRYLYNAEAETIVPFLQYIKDLKHVADQKQIPVYVGEIITEPDEVMKH